MKYFFVVLFFLGSSQMVGQIIEEDSAGEFAPDFTYTSLEGEQIRLAEWQGKVVYVAFWASWCKPCLQGFEKYAEVRREMKELGVVLLNISIDKSEAAWKKAVANYGIEGEHGLVAKMDLMESYQLYNVPRYEIVGKDGRFLYLDREDGKSVMDNFQEFLKMK